MRGIFSVDSSVMRALIKLFDCICASILWLLFSLPIVTMGAASAALYTTVRRYLRRDEGHLWSTFWGAFRENLRRSTLVWLAALGVLALLAADALVFRGLKLGGSPLGDLYWVILALSCGAVTWTAYLSAYGARFSGRARDVLRFSFILMAAHPVRALGVFLPILAGAALVITGPQWAAIVPTAVCWLNSVVIEQVFLLHMRPEDAEKAQGGSSERESSR